MGEKLSFVEAVNFAAEMAGGGNLVIFAHVFNVFVGHGVQCVKQLVAAAAAAEMIFFGFGNLQLVGMKQAGKNFFGGELLVKNFFSFQALGENDGFVPGFV